MDKINLSITGSKRKRDIERYESSGESDSENCEFNCDWWPDKYFIESPTLEVFWYEPLLEHQGPENLVDGELWDVQDLYELLDMEWVEFDFSTIWFDTPFHDTATITSVESENNSIVDFNDMPPLEDINDFDNEEIQYNEAEDVTDALNPEVNFDISAYYLSAFQNELNKLEDRMR